ncbi:MAG: SDR family NAD(P)-dependent oxidoreductase [Angustibacter sp.]
MTDGATDVAPDVVLVTGATSGIGLAVALEVAERGGHLALVARSADRLGVVAARCLAAGATSVATHAADVADAEAVQAVVDTVVAEHGRLDAVVHSAGVVAYGRLEEVPADVFDGVVRTNVLGSANVARAVLPTMRAADRGRLYLVGSVIGGIGVPGMGAYVVSKWGVRALARQLQLENRDRDGVHVTLVRPGSVDTPIYTLAANYSGFVGAPPPPVYRPETVARRIVESFGKPPQVLNVGIANPLMLLGFSLLPAVYDVLVGPLFRVLGRTGERVGATPGNVLAPTPEGERLRG